MYLICVWNTIYIGVVVRWFQLIGMGNLQRVHEILKRLGDHRFYHSYTTLSHVIDT